MKGCPEYGMLRKERCPGVLSAVKGLYLAAHRLAPTVGGCAAVEDGNTPITLPDSLTPVSAGSTQKLSDNRDGTVNWVISDQGA